MLALKGIEPYEVLQVLAARRRLPIPGRSGGIPVLAIIGRTRTGRALLVVVHVGSDFDQEIVGAREPTREEMTMFEHWEASTNER